jgi:hypothetical protein
MGGQHHRRVAHEGHGDVARQRLGDLARRRPLRARNQPEQRRPQEPQREDAYESALGCGTHTPTVLVIDLLGALDHVAIVAVFARGNHVRQE